MAILLLDIFMVWFRTFICPRASRCDDLCSGWLAKPAGDCKVTTGASRITIGITLKKVQITFVMALFRGILERYFERATG